MIEQKFIPNKNILNIEDVVIDSNGLSQDRANEKTKILYEVPQVYYYGVEFPMSFVPKLIIDTNKFMPTCYIVFNDVTNIIHNIGMPTDNAKITVILPTNGEFFSNIFLEFKIESFHIEMSRSSNSKKIHMWGILNVENLLIKDYKSYDLTSYQVFENIAKESGLGLMSNISSSNDKMKWLNPGDNVYKFLQSCLDRSWVSESSYVWGFIDLYYNLNYIDVEKSLQQDVKELTWLVNNIEKKKIEEVTPPYLTNENGFAGTNLYYTGEKIINQSTKISLNNGYIRNVAYYDFDGNWSEKAGSYKEYTLDTITTPGSESTSIILKGEPGNVDFYNKNQTYHWLGKLDTKNMHPDYLWAKAQNKENLKDLQKISMQITLPKINFNIKRFEKFKMLYVNNNENIKNDYDNKLLNGDWLATGYSLEWNGKSYFQTVNIVKRELQIGL